MTKMTWMASVAAVLVWCLASQGVTYRYSLDLGSDQDKSDPVTTSNNWMDCGDVWKESTPTRWKNDCNQDGEGQELGYAMNGTNPQPDSSIVADPNNIHATPTDVRAQYGSYWDVDDDDQIGFRVPNDMISDPRLLYRSGDGKTRAEWEAMGIHYQPSWVAVSYEDDGPNGWYKSGEIPTKYDRWQCNGTSLYKDEVSQATGDFGNWSSPTGVRTENALGLEENPSTTAGDQKYNDDVDGLDIEDHDYWYFTPDHEANLGYDPGSVYVTDANYPNQMMVQILDDVKNIGVTQDTDVSGLEFCSIGYQKYYDIFGYYPTDMDENDDVLCLLFSVKDIDFDCMPVGWDPRTSGDNDPSIDDFYGRLNAGTLSADYIYISNLAGRCKPLQSMWDPVDAITVPEPGTMALVVLGGLATWRRKKS